MKDDIQINKYLKKAEEAFEEDKLIKALDLYSKIYELSNGKNLDAIINLALIYDSLGKSEKAKEYYKEALKIEPNNHLALFNMGVICYKFNMIKKAINFYERSIEKDKCYEYSYLNLAVIYKYIDTKKGIEILSHGITNCNEVYFLYYNRSCFYALINEENKACEDIIMALKLYPQFLKYVLEDEELEKVRNLSLFKEFMDKNKLGEN